MRAFILLLLVLVAVAAATVPSPYFIMAPGGAYEIEPRLQVAAPYREPMGRLAFTAVLVRPGSWAAVIQAALDPTEEIVPAEEVIPPGTSQEELNEIQQQLMEESKLVAAVVALQAAGFEARITGEGAEVIQIIAGMPAEGVLRAGDVIVQVDGQEVQTAIDVIEAVRRHEVGEAVQFTILRDGERLQVETLTRSSVEEPGRPVVGAAIRTRLFDVELPIEIEISTEAVGGPSGGLMLALAVLDAVTEGVLTRGYAVAGTGTIAPDGSVGPIGGAAEKVVAARRDGYTVFLVPRSNLQEAQRTAEEIRLIPVDSFSGAIQALCALEPLTGFEEPAPEPCVAEESAAV